MNFKIKSMSVYTCQTDMFTFKPFHETIVVDILLAASIVSKKQTYPV